jgi:hypothetical protein
MGDMKQRAPTTIILVMIYGLDTKGVILNRREGGWFPLKVGWEPFPVNLIPVKK